MSIFVGLSGLADYSAAQPFINVLKCGRRWEGRSASAWVQTSSDAMKSGGHLDGNGNPIRIPSGANRVGTIILCEINAADTTLNGRYRLTWTGDGTVSVQGVGGVTRGAGWLEFDYRASGGNMVLIDLTAISPTNPIKLVSCVRTDHLARHATGEIFRPAWLQQIRGFPLLRFMDWMSTNNSKQRIWADRTPVSSFSYVLGAPVEVMVALCNVVGADPWFCIPHLATDDYITRFAQYVRTNLRADLTARYEYSNEVWNFMFGQAQWANEQALRLWPDYVNQDGWMQFYGARASEMAILIDQVYSGTTGRHRKVITTHTAWLGLEQGMLEAPKWVAMQQGRRAPRLRFDDYAVTGYFGHGLGAQQVQDWRTSLSEAQAFERMAGVLDREITGLERQWRDQKAIADKAGLRLVMYEGGTHITPDHGVLNQNTGLLDFIEKFNYSAYMKPLYSRAIAGFKAAGGEAFNVFVEMERASKHGFWGGLRHASDSNPRWDAITAAMAEPDVTPAPVDPAPVIPTPQPQPPFVTPKPPVVDPIPDPKPNPTPTPDLEPSSKETNMAEQKLLTEILSGLDTITTALKAHLAAEPATPAPVTPPVQPPVTPPVQPPVTPPVTPSPQILPTGYRATQDFKIDKDLQFDWSAAGGVNIFLPNWAGGDRGNGVGGSLGTPRRVVYPDAKSVAITAGMEEGRWLNGALQLNRPTSAIGKWGAVVTSETATAVNAFFTYAGNSKELDFELVKRNGVIGWAPAVHMPRTGGGRASSDRRQLKLGEFKLGVPQRLEFELFADRCEFSIDGKVFEIVRHVDMGAGFNWDTTTGMATFATIERHQSWAGWSAADYANENRMTIHGFRLPTMP